MADTTFTDRVTVIATEWLNEVNNLVHTIFSDPANAAEARTALGAGDASGPASSVDDNVVTFDGTGGKTIQDSGVAISAIASTAASQAEMEAGTETAIRTMSPLRVKQAIDSLAPTDLMALQRGEGTADTSAASTTTQSFSTLSDEYTVTPTNASGTTLLGYFVVDIDLEASAQDLVSTSLSVGYENSSSVDTEVGATYIPYMLANGTTDVRWRGIVLLPFNLDDTQQNAAGNWVVMIRGKTATSGSELFVRHVRFFYEEFSA